MATPEQDHRDFATIAGAKGAEPQFANVAGLRLYEVACPTVWASMTFDAIPWATIGPVANASARCCILVSWSSKYPVLRVVCKFIGPLL